LDLEGFKRNIIEAQSNALTLSLNAAYPLPENIVLLIQTAHRKAFNLALNAAIATAETISDLLRKAHAEASSLNAKLSKVEEKAQPQSSQPTTEPSVQKG
jgi:large subunit ribosomal protein L10